MANIVIYDPADALVPGRVTQYLPSVNTPDYDSVVDKIVSPDLTAVAGVPLKYWVEKNGDIEEMSVPQKAAIDDAEAAERDLGIRSDAKENLDVLNSPGLVLRALADVIKDEINILRAEHGFADRTLVQLRTAIKNKVDSGDAD